MTFAQIESFYLAATLGTFAMAAERLNTTQPAVSARIMALEQEIGVRLFDRTGHRIALTPEGRGFLAHAEKLLEVKGEALRMFGTQQLTGVLRIGVSDTMAITWFPNFLSRVQELYPEVTVEVHIGPTYRLREQLLSRQIDVGFVNGPLSDSEMINELLCDCPVVFAAAPSLALHGKKLPARAFERYDIYTFGRMTRPYHDLARRLRESGVQSRLSPISSLQAIILFMRQGLGVGAVPLCVIEEDIETGRLVALDSEIALDELRFTASYIAGPDTYVAEAITHLAIETLRTLPRTGSIKFLYETPS